MLDDEVEQLLQRAVVAGAGVMAEVLEMAEAQEARRGAHDDRAGLDPLALHRQGRADQRQRAGGRDAQAVHRLRAQELADRRAQHRAAVAPARIGGAAAALELDLARAGGRVDLAEQQRAAVAELAGPLAELVAAVDGGHRRHARPRRSGREGLERARRLPPVGRPAQLGGRGLAGGDPVRRRQRLAGLRRGERGLQSGMAVDPAQRERIEGGGIGIHARQCRRGACGAAGRGNSARGSH